MREAGIKVCSGGIVGMGEGPEDRVDMLVTLANLEEHPESVPINMLIAIPGTPLENVEKIDAIDFVRTIAVARIMMPKSYVRLSAGRTEMSDETQALVLLRRRQLDLRRRHAADGGKPGRRRRCRLFAKLGLKPLNLRLNSRRSVIPPRRGKHAGCPSFMSARSTRWRGAGG